MLHDHSSRRAPVACRTYPSCGHFLPVIGVRKSPDFFSLQVLHSLACHLSVILSYPLALVMPMPQCQNQLDAVLCFQMHNLLSTKYICDDFGCDKVKLTKA